MTNKCNILVINRTTVVSFSRTTEESVAMSFGASIHVVSSLKNNYYNNKYIHSQPQSVFWWHHGDLCSDIGLKEREIVASYVFNSSLV
jgi:hypothetical protein